jgi:hypothetical protein
VWCVSTAALCVSVDLCVSVGESASPDERVDSGAQVPSRQHSGIGMLDLSLFTHGLSIFLPTRRVRRVDALAVIGSPTAKPASCALT